MLCGEATNHKGDGVGFTWGIFEQFANILYSKVFQKAFYNSHKYDKFIQSYFEVFKQPPSTKLIYGIYGAYPALLQ